jgi:hypothetical protein
MTEPRTVTGAEAVAIVSDLAAENARYRAAFDAIISRATSTGTPPHWIATVADLPDFLAYCKTRGIIIDLPTVSDPESFCALCKKAFLSGPVPPGAWVGYYKAGQVRKRLLESPLLSAEEKARVPRLGRVKELLHLLAAREQPDYVGETKGGSFCFEWPDAYALYWYSKNYPADFLRYLLRKAFLSEPPNVQGFIGPHLPEELRALLMDSPALSAELKAAIPPADRIFELLKQLSHTGQKRGVITYKGGKASIYWPDAYQKFLNENNL